MKKKSSKNRYTRLIEKIFDRGYTEGITEIPFIREDLETTAMELGISLPKNLGDIIYSFRYRAAMPETIQKRTPEGKTWVIRTVGRSKYLFSLTEFTKLSPNALLAETKIPDATPGVIAKYALSDEQALLAKLRYNRLIDIFTGVTCYSLQNHLRTTVSGIGQVETDEIYIGIDQHGVQYVFPVQAKGGKDQLGIIQIEQDFALCKEKFPLLFCCPIAAQFMEDNLIALFVFENGPNGVAISDEKHYRLVSAEDMTDEDIATYRHRIKKV